jgi:FkbM family methyltransferase
MLWKTSQLVNELIGVWRTADRATFLAYLAAVTQSLPHIFWDRSLRSADEGMIGRQCSFRPFDKKIILAGKYFGLAREIYCRKCYFPLPSYWLKPTDCVVDLGANVGCFSTLAGLHANKVIAVEAQSGFAGELEANFRQNNVLDKVRVEFGVIGSRCGVFGDETQLKQASHYEFCCPSISFSDLIERYQLEKIDFLKVDIEGSEFDLFDDCTSWLWRVRKIAMEFHLGFGDVDAIIKTLKNQGFHAWPANKAGRTITDFKKVNIGYIFANKF